MTIQTFGNGGIEVTGKSSISIYRLLVLLKGIKLELKGLRKHGPSCYSVIKREFSVPGTREQVAERFEEIVQQKINEIRDAEHN